MIVAVTSTTDTSVWENLLSVVIYGLGAGVGVSVIFAVAIRGLATAGAARRDGVRGPVPVLWGVVGVVGVALCLAATALGVVTMLHR